MSKNERMSTEKRMSKPEPVKAWAIVQDGAIGTTLLYSMLHVYAKESEALALCPKNTTVIPVLITPLESGEEK